VDGRRNTTVAAFACPIAAPTAPGSATTASRASAADTYAARMAAAAWDPMVIEENANPDLNVIASLMPAAGVYEHLTGAIIGA
jgi:hypothetical protein